MPSRKAARSRDSDWRGCRCPGRAVASPYIVLASTACLGRIPLGEPGGASTSIAAQLPVELLHLVRCLRLATDASAAAKAGCPRDGLDGPAAGNSKFSSIGVSSLLPPQTPWPL